MQPESKARPEAKSPMAHDLLSEDDEFDRFDDVIIEEEGEKPLRSSISLPSAAVGVVAEAALEAVRVLLASAPTVMLGRVAEDEAAAVEDVAVESPAAEALVADADEIN